MLSDEKIRGRLTSLQISNTPLTRVPASVCRMSVLASLNLDNNRVIGLPDNCFTNMTRLQTLSARSNNITELQDGLFDSLHSLRELYFGSNSIASIGLNLFSNPNNLLNLRRIMLDMNRLRSLDPWPYVRGLHGSPNSTVDINLDFNHISEFSNNIHWQFNCTRRSYANVSIRDTTIRHINDVLEGWNVTSLADWTCIKHCRYKGSVFQMDYSWTRDYRCDCRDFDLYHSFFIDRSTFRYITCVQPLSLVHKYVIEIPLGEFVCDELPNCPSSCRCVYRPANATLHVYCSSSIYPSPSLPLVLPPLTKSYDRYKLDFSNNKRLRHLEHRSYFANTSILDVSDCAIEVVDLNAWRDFAKTNSPFVTPLVYLHNNEIESLPFEVTGIDLSSVRLTLGGNPWTCSCDNRWMIAWFKSLPYSADVLCASPSRLEGRSITQSTEDDFCVDPTVKMLKISLSSTLSATVVLLMIGFAVYRLRVRLYTKWKFHPFDRDECNGEDMDYDVFLCFSSEDHNPHGVRILELLESSGYRVCYHIRDFRGGTLISDNIQQAITRSKRTVCFLSNNFLQR